MTADQLYVQVVKRSEDEFIIKRISTDKKIWYLLPEEFQDLTHHKILTSKKIIRNATTVIKNINGFRNITLKIDEHIRREYFDEAQNVCFNEFPLEEEIALVPVSRVIEPRNNELETRIRQLEQELKSNSIKKNQSRLKDIENKFILNKFEKKQYDSMSWLSRFEDECHRFQIVSDSDKVQALRFFVIGSAGDWYESNLKKIGLNTPWKCWKDSFLNVFVDKGWTIVRKAFNYKYLGGSLIDFALAKEKLCLEMEPNSTELSRVNQIVFGLPVEAQEKLDREEIITIDMLFSKLRRLEDTFNRKKKDVQTTTKLNTIPNTCERFKSQKTIEPQRKPCPNCATLGFPNRYHSLNECRNRNLKDQNPRSNIVKHCTNKNEFDILKIDLDNEDLN